MLKKRQLGNSGLEVTEFCLGLLPMGPLQADLPEEKCVGIIKLALQLGVNFFDTAEAYRTQKYLGKALRGWPEKVIISSKSMACDYDGMAASIDKALREMDTGSIDVYHLHAPKALANLFQERAGALHCLQKAKSEKIIGAIGVATHNPAVVKAAAERDDIDILFVLLNQKGLGLYNGTLTEMIQAVKLAGSLKKGVYAMKALAGGNYYQDPETAFSWIRAVSGINSVAVGVVNKEELLCNLSIFGLRGLVYDRESLSKNKKVHISTFICQGCGACMEACPNEALTLINKKAVVDSAHCLVCGYCGPACPVLAIRVI